MATDESQLAGLLAQIAEVRGMDCGAYKQSCLRRRLAVRMRARGVHTYGDYARVLERDAAEYDRLVDALTINVTKFYRNRETWDVLGHRYLPALWDARHGAVRCWSAGCATGEEPYTLAMLLLEAARARARPLPAGARVDATDLDPDALARAAAGAYRAPAFEELPPDLAARYFDGEPQAVRPAVRAVVRFRRQDLLRDPPPQPPYDLILCRNVVIYFDRATQERLFDGFADALAPAGCLVLGKVETLFGAARGRFRLDDARERIYRLA